MKLHVCYVSSHSVLRISLVEAHCRLLQILSVLSYAFTCYIISKRQNFTVGLDKNPFPFMFYVSNA